MAGLLNCIVDLRTRADRLQARVDELEGEVRGKQGEIDKQRIGIIQHDRMMRADTDKHCVYPENTPINTNFL